MWGRKDSEVCLGSTTDVVLQEDPESVRLNRRTRTPKGPRNDMETTKYKKYVDVVD